MKIIVSIILLFLGSSLSASELLDKARTLFKPVPETPPELKDNTLAAEKVELGKMLYFDPRLSTSWLISCNTCHNVGLGGVDLLETSIGHGWQKGHRNAPTVFNAVFNIAQFWDGRAEDLKAQAKGPVQAGVEMSNTPERVEKTLASIPEYVELFKMAFSDEKTPVTFDNMAKAIEAFEATLLTPDSRFDRYLKGNTEVLSAEEKKGLKLFMDKGCSACHGGINLGGDGYYPFGVTKKPGADLLPSEDKGRFAVTRSATDEYVFRSPPLRNVTITPPYFHTGKVWSLKQAVAIMGSSQLGITLSDQETEEIVAFLGTLTGRQPQVQYPILPPSTQDTPRPVVDQPDMMGAAH